MSKALIANGFERRGRTHIRRATEDFSMIVDTGPLGKRTDIAPWVGLRSDAVETAYCELADLPGDDYVASIGANVGYVLDGQYRYWMPPDSSEAVLAAVFEAFERLRPYMSLSGIIEAYGYIPVANTDPAMWRRRAVICLLLGDDAGVLDALESGRAENCRYKGEVCAYFMAFSNRVHDRLVA